MVEPMKVSRKKFVENQHIRWNAMNDLCALSELKDLTPIQRAAHLAYWYMSEVENGGHFQYFVNKMEFDHNEVISALRKIDATEQATVLASALKTGIAEMISFPETAEEYLSEEKEAALSEYDRAFHECKKSICEILEDYLDKYESEFIEWTA